MRNHTNSQANIHYSMFLQFVLTKVFKNNIAFKKNDKLNKRRMGFNMLNVQSYYGDIYLFKINT